MSTENASSSAATTRVGSAFDGLADETILEIMSNLDYLAMSRLMSVSKKFDRLIKDRSFDESMFRQRPKKPFKSGEVRLHPFLKTFDGSWPYNGIEGDFLLRIGHEHKRLVQKKVMDEFASSPCCQTLVMDALIPPPMTITNPDGVRVIDVLFGIKRMWGRFENANGEERKRRIGTVSRSKTSFKQDEGNPDYEEIEMYYHFEPETWWDMMHSLGEADIFCGWWEPIRMTEEGLVKLKCQGYAQ